MPASMRVAKRIDRWVASTKWAAAMMAAILAPLFLHAIGLWIRRIGQYPVYATLFAAGAGIVVVLCRTDIATNPWVRNAVAYERRLTQSLLAMVFLYPISRLVGTPDPNHPWSRWLGKGNWVILASPYFIPAASIVLWLLSWVILPAPLRSFVIGFGVAYHVASVVLQWVHSTSELRRLGRKFCVLFLIPANLLVIGCGFAFALNGFTGLFQFMHDIIAPLQQAWEWVTASS